MAMSEHDPMQCRGDNGGGACSDDPCWACIEWAFDKVKELQAELEQAQACIPANFYEGSPFIERLKMLVELWQRAIQVVCELDREHDKAQARGELIAYTKRFSLCERHKDTVWGSCPACDNERTLKAAENEHGKA